MSISTISNETFDQIELVSVGTTTLDAILDQGTFNLITHNLGIVPMVLATAHSPNFPANNRVMLPWVEDPGDATFHVIAQISNVTSTIVQFEVNLGSGATGHDGEWEIKYWLLRDRAN